MAYRQEHITPYGGADGKEQQIERMFNRLAPTYDRLNGMLSMGIDRYWRRKAIATLKAAAPQSILDVATGTGDFAIEACRALNPGRLTAIDISTEMMAVGAEKVQKARLAHQITFRRANATDLPFADDSFDAVTVAFGVRNFVGLDKGLQEMLRVLRPGGQLVILELSTPRHFPLKQLYRLYSRTVMPVEGRLISKDDSAYTYLPNSIKACPQGSGMRTIIAKAGFGNVRSRELTLGICSLYTASKPS